MVVNPAPFVLAEVVKASSVDEIPVERVSVTGTVDDMNLPVANVEVPVDTDKLSADGGEVSKVLGVTVADNVSTVFGKTAVDMVADFVPIDVVVVGVERKTMVSLELASDVLIKFVEVGGESV